MGHISSRSSTGAGGPPGEAEILALNPQREQALRDLTGWQRIEPGTLNVECYPAELIRVLDSREPDWFEAAETVKYPQAFAHIPAKRGGYRYFRARAHANGRTASVVIRRAVNPLKTRIEVFGDARLKDTLMVEDESEILLHLQ